MTCKKLKQSKRQLMKWCAMSVLEVAFFFWIFKHNWSISWLFICQFLHLFFFSSFWSKFPFSHYESDLYSFVQNLLVLVREKHKWKDQIFYRILHLTQWLRRRLCGAPMSAATVSYSRCIRELLAGNLSVSFLNFFSSLLWLHLLQ